MATADKLNKLIETKANIKEAIKAKGVTVNDSDTFASYPSKIASISGGGDKIILPEGTKFSKSDFTVFDVSIFDFSNVAKYNYMFYECYSIESLDFSKSGIIKPTITAHMFNNCARLKVLNLENINNSVNKNYTGMFNNCSALEDLRFNDLGHLDISDLGHQSIDISYSPKLTKESVLYLFENAFDRAAGYTNPFTITLHPDTKALLTEEEIAIATNKGFTVV